MSAESSSIDDGILGRTSAMWVAIAVLAAIWLAMLTLGAGRADKAILLALYAGSRPLLVAVARALTVLGSWPVVVFVALAAAWRLTRDGRRRTALLLIAGTAIARLLVVLQKHELGRLRPDEHLRLVHVSSLSFPSGHSANSMLVYPLCALLLAPGPWRKPMLVAAVLLSMCIGASRVLLGVHWPSDVVGGWSFGLLCVLAIVRTDQALADNRRP